MIPKNEVLSRLRTKHHTADDVRKVVESAYSFAASVENEKRALRGDRDGFLEFRARVEGNYLERVKAMAAPLSKLREHCTTGDGRENVAVADMAIFKATHALAQAAGTSVVAFKLKHGLV